MSDVAYAEALLADALAELGDTARRLGISEAEIEAMIEKELRDADFLH